MVAQHTVLVKGLCVLLQVVVSHVGDLTQIKYASKVDEAECGL